MKMPAMELMPTEEVIPFIPMTFTKSLTHQIQTGTGTSNMARAQQRATLGVHRNYCAQWNTLNHSDERNNVVNCNMENPTRMLFSGTMY